MNAIADAIVYAVTYINCRDVGDDDDDVGALESIADLLHKSTAAEQDQLAAAAERALEEERSSASPREDFVRDYEYWMEEMFGDSWSKTCRVVD
jgi:hypothetical protein